MCYKCELNLTGLAWVETRVLTKCGHVDEDRTGQLVLGMRLKETRVDADGRTHILDYNTCSHCCVPHQTAKARMQAAADMKKRDSDSE